VSALPKKLPDGSVVISAKQVRLHKQWELVAFLVGTPLLLYAGTRERPLNSVERAGILAIGFGGLLVDLHLYRQFKKLEK